MKTQVRKSGKNLAIFLPESLIQGIPLQQGTLVDIRMIDHQLVIDLPQVLQSEKSLTLEQVLAEITEENIHHEIESGMNEISSL